MAKGNKKVKHGNPFERQNRFGWVFCLPFLLGLFFIYLDVLIDSLKFSFSDIQMGTTGYSLSFIGFKHYLYALTIDADFLPALVSSAMSFLGGIPVTVIFSLFIATLLNQKMKGRTVFRALFFVPVILVTGIVTVAESGNTVLANYQEMAGVNAGTGTNTALDLTNIQNILTDMHIGSDVVTYVVNLVDNIYNVVNRSGVQIILFLAGLQSISPSIYEAAYIEGSKGWEVFWKITLPMISPIVLVNCLYTTIDIFTSSTNPIMNMITSTVGSNLSYGAASAMAWLYFLMICVFLGIIAFIGRRLVFHQEKT